MLEEISSAWGWKGVEPQEIVEENAFGNVIFRDRTGTFWRICPEVLSCEMIARDNRELEDLFRDEEFLEDWTMRTLVVQAYAKLGPLPEDRCYCLKIPDVLGGGYSVENMGTISRAEVLLVSGELAEQIKDMPDGTRVRISIVD